MSTTKVVVVASGHGLSDVVGNSVVVADTLVGTSTGGTDDATSPGVEPQSPVDDSVVAPPPHAAQIALEAATNADARINLPMVRSTPAGPSWFPRRGAAPSDVQLATRSSELFCADHTRSGHDHPTYYRGISHHLPG